MYFTLRTIRSQMGEYLGIPPLDWGNNLNCGFIFFLGFAITAAEEKGLGKVMHQSRWKYLVTGFLFSCLRVGSSVALASDWIPRAVDGLIR